MSALNLHIGPIDTHRRREYFYSAECLNGHEFDNESDLDVEAFERGLCPKVVNGRRCGATLTVRYLRCGAGNTAI